jgi:hypothetical protein
MTFAIQVVNKEDSPWFQADLLPASYFDLPTTAQCYSVLTLRSGMPVLDGARGPSQKPNVGGFEHLRPVSTCAARHQFYLDLFSM